MVQSLKVGDLCRKIELRNRRSLIVEIDTSKHKIDENSTPYPQKFLNELASAKNTLHRKFHNF